MTRINVVPVSELCNKHLFAEWREMPRLVANLKTSLNRKTKPFTLDEIPKEYKLGSGHVKFFYDKFMFLHDRHRDLTNELIHRGYNLGTTDSSIFATVSKEYYNNYEPTKEALDLNRERIVLRLPANPRYRKA